MDTIKKIFNWLSKAFSEEGVPSSKRICGGFIIFVVSFCTFWAAIKYGVTREVESVLQTEIISACALLGISSVTSIWKRKGEE